MTAESPDAPLRALLEQAVPLARPGRLGRLILQSDPQFHRIPAGERSDVVRMALDAGATLAQDLVARHATRDPQRLAEYLEVRVVPIDDAGRYGTILQYAEYRSRRPEIRVYRRSMDRLNRLLAQPPVAERLGMRDATPGFLAHELFHHLDNLPGRQPLRRRRQVVTLRLGRFRVRSGLITVPEIAAGSFAQALLSLPFHLKLLDLLAIFSENAARAAEWVRALAEGADDAPDASPPEAQPCVSRP